MEIKRPLEDYRSKNTGRVADLKIGKSQLKA
jgi:hypothetical protein